MKKVLFLILYLIPMFTNAQSTNVDSLVNLLNTQKLNDDEAIDLYWNIALTYWGNDLEKTISYANEGLNLSKKGHRELWSARFSRVIGFSYIDKDEYDSSLDNLKNAITFAIKANNKQEENIATTYMGTLYLRQGQYEQALKYFMDALPSLEELKQNEHYANTLLNVAILYKYLRNDEKALEYCERAFIIAEQYDLPYTKMVSSEVRGDIYYSQQQYDSAVVYMLKAYDIAHQRNDKLRLATSTQMLANLYGSLKDYDEAERYADECLKIANELGNINQLLMAWSVMSYVRFEQKRYKESEVYANKMWEADSTQLFWAANASYRLCNINIFLNNHQKATYFLDKYIDIRDQSSNEELSKSLADMEVKYETGKKEMRISALEKEQALYIWLGVAIAVALLSVIGLLIYRHRSAVQKRKLAEQQVKQLGQENELIAARSALDAEKAEREIIARDLHDGVGVMLSVVKNNMDIIKSYSVVENQELDYFNKALDGLDKSIVELRRVAHHIMPAILVEKGLFTALDDFCRSIPEVEFHFAEPYHRFDQEKELVLYRCAYELVNNALRHAGASHIDVHLNMDERTIYLSVVDNGCGFDPKTASMGMGINNMRTRLSVFNGRMDIYSEKEKGTEVNIELDL